MKPEFGAELRQGGVSVIVPCFNASVWIRDALRSVASQGLEGLEVIVVDDGSSDGSDEIVEKEFGFATLIRTVHEGASRARNLGTNLASGEFIQYLDADDLLAESKVDTQLAALQETGADVAYGNWQKLTRITDGFVAGEIVCRTMGDEPELDLFGAFWCPPAAYLFRRSIVAKVGGWNEGLQVIQDARFALDCALHGATFVYCDRVMAQYRVHETGSLSRRSPREFTRDVYRNAGEVESWWRDRGGVTDARRRALVSCLGYVARASYEQDRETFEAAVTDLKRLNPRYVPDHPLHLKIASHLIGYRHAERAAALYRRAKRSLSLAAN